MISYLCKNRSIQMNEISILDLTDTLQKLPIFVRQKRSCGRVVRQSSAKAPTAVRIRSGPLKGIINEIVPFSIFTYPYCYRLVFRLL